VTVLTVVWSGALLAILLKLFWVKKPKWLSAVIGLTLGWAGIAAFPEIYGEIGLAGVLFLAAGGLFYTAGGIIYALRRPNLIPGVFGYHELFHAFVIVAVALQYVSVAVYVLPGR
jgi:hemolysin III